MKKFTILFPLLIVMLPMHAFWKTTTTKSYTAKIVYDQWGINAEDPDNVEVSYKGNLFKDSKKFTTKNINNAKIEIDKKDISQRYKDSVKNNLTNSWGFISSIDNLTRYINKNFKTPDAHAKVLDDIVYKKDYAPYYPYSYLSQVLFGATILGLIGVAYWQRDIIHQYSRDALNTIVTSETIKSKMGDLQQYVPTKELLQQGYSSFLNKLPAWPSFNPQ